MAFRISIAAALLTVLTLSGCMTSQKNAGLANPLSKGDFSVSRNRKKPLTQIALDALKPNKTPVKIVSPMDWFRGTSSVDEVAAQVTGEQLTKLAAQYRAGAQQAGNVAQTAQNIAQPIANVQKAVSPLLNFSSPNGTTGATPSQTAMPSVPQNQIAQYQAIQNLVSQKQSPQFPMLAQAASVVSSAKQNVAAQMPQVPKVQFQSARLPLGQPVANVRQAAAQYAVSPNKGVAQATSIAQAAMTQSVFPPVNAKVQLPASTPMAYPSTSASAINSMAHSVTNTTAGFAYPTTSQQSLPSIPTAINQPTAPVYR